MIKKELSCALAYNWHDSSAAFAIDNKIVLVLEAERVFRQKKMMCSVSQMKKLIEYGCFLLGATVSNVRHIALQTLGNPHLSHNQKLPKSPSWHKVDF